MREWGDVLSDRAWYLCPTHETPPISLRSAASPFKWHPTAGETLTVAKRPREPKTEVLFARMTPAQIDFLKRAADAEHLALAVSSPVK